MRKITRWWSLAVAALLLSFTASAQYLNTSASFTESTVTEGDVLVLLVPEHENTLSVPGWSNESNRHLQRALSAADFTGKARQQADILAPAGLSFDRLLVLGVGAPSEFPRHSAELLGADLAVYVDRAKAERVVVDAGLITGASENRDIVAAVAHGVDLRNYRFDRYKSEPAARPAAQFTWIVTSRSNTETAYGQMNALAQGVFIARELTNLPGSDGYPAAFAEYARQQLEPLGVEVRIYDREQVKALGMGSLLSVSEGSQHKSHLLVAHYKNNNDERPIALVGKGNTFDTGGYNLKTNAASILRMQTDKAGGAAVVGAVKALAGQQAPVNVVGVVPLSRNMISGEATLPGDVVVAGDGTTIEVANTDAEGRLILADGIWYAREHLNARAIADIATLTGAKVGALGTEYSAVFTDDETILRTMREAGDLTRERVWQLPMDGYERVIQSRIADIKNTGAPGAQAGAIFLRHFAGDTPWIHIDMAGSALIDSASGIHPEGATGYGVRLLTEWVKLYSGE
ncbi:leucyl aminopeptidase family protein [Aliidiomarina sanyensis]|uniref:Probable cytosol aminopeptidase n=1 Tax=Aliidiomarina sanyensis TaxID=1249555 RepID=A0A432WPY4_9GAMM|nr:leucyl aminopeptidase [Aliidiomarina sanyensis]RUO35737.1 peptidase M17 [Aliidiomarina sanyensis]